MLIRTAALKPQRAPSFMMVRLMGPTGTERMKPLMNPVSAATKNGKNSPMGERRNTQTPKHQNTQGIDDGARGENGEAGSRSREIIEEVRSSKLQVPSPK